MMRLRPWPLATAGMARSLGTWFILPELVGLVIAGDRRWSSARIVLRSLFGANAGETTRRISNALAESLRVLFKLATTFLPFD